MQGRLPRGVQQQPPLTPDQVAAILQQQQQQQSADHIYDTTPLIDPVDVHKEVGSSRTLGGFLSLCLQMHCMREAIEMKVPEVSHPNCMIGSFLMRPAAFPTENGRERFVDLFRRMIEQESTDDLSSHKTVLPLARKMLKLLEESVTKEKSK